MNKSECLHVNLTLVAKAPRAGYVKTRLQKSFSPQQACDIYSCLLSRARALAESWQQTRPDIRLILAFDPPDLPQLWDTWSAWSKLPQISGDLGDRLRAVVASGTPEGRSAFIFIGADAPELSCQNLDWAKDNLLYHDAVMIPSNDGGYVLLGLHASATALLTGINWGTDQVRWQTQEIARNAGLKLADTTPISDIDFAEDIAELISRLLCSSDAHDKALAAALLKITA